VAVIGESHSDLDFDLFLNIGGLVLIKSSGGDG
jgi:hypothetical protein